MEPKFEVGDVVKWKILGGYCFGEIDCIVQVNNGCLYSVPNCWLKKDENDLELVKKSNNTV